MKKFLKLFSGLSSVFFVLGMTACSSDSDKAEEAVEPPSVALVELENTDGMYIQVTSDDPDSQVCISLDDTDPDPQDCVSVRTVGITEETTVRAMAVSITSGKQSEIVSFTACPDGMVKVSGGTVKGSSSYVCWKNYYGGFINGRTVTLSDFYISDHEVTQDEYSDVMETNPSLSYTHGTQGDNPVNQVCWYDAVIYCNKRSIAEGLAPCYSYNDSTDPSTWGSYPTNDRRRMNIACDLTAAGYRLPTEAEWEYAARGGNPSSKKWKYEYAGAKSTHTGNPWDDTGLDSVGWYIYNVYNEGVTPSEVTYAYEEFQVDYTKTGAGTYAVRSKKPNFLGLYGMSGNVSEWCQDKWQDSFSEGNETDPVYENSSDNHSVLRGGNWTQFAYLCSVVNREKITNYQKNGYYGFRVVRTAQE